VPGSCSTRPRWPAVHRSSPCRPHSATPRTRPGHPALASRDGSGNSASMRRPLGTASAAETTSSATATGLEPRHQVNRIDLKEAMDDRDRLLRAAGPASAVRAQRQRLPGHERPDMRPVFGKLHIIRRSERSRDTELRIAFLAIRTTGILSSRWELFRLLRRIVGFIPSGPPVINTGADGCHYSRRNDNRVRCRRGTLLWVLAPSQTPYAGGRDHAARSVHSCLCIAWPRNHLECGQS
jgi:hypothetical protein